MKKEIKPTWKDNFKPGSDRTIPERYCHEQITIKHIDATAASIFIKLKCLKQVLINMNATFRAKPETISKVKDPITLIGWGFDWNNTPEGEEYWFKIYNKVKTLSR